MLARALYSVPPEVQQRQTQNNKLPFSLSFCAGSEAVNE